MAFRKMKMKMTKKLNKKQTARKSRYSAKRRTWKAGAPRPSSRSTRSNQHNNSSPTRGPRFMDPNSRSRSLSPIAHRASTHNTITNMENIDDSFTLTPPTSPSRPRQQ